VHTLTIDYLGDSRVAASTGTFTLTIRKAPASVAASITPSTIVARETVPIVHVRVDAAIVTPTGTVTVESAGHVVGIGTLDGGTVDIAIDPFPTAGQRKVTIIYEGDAYVLREVLTRVVRVVPPA
jgi:hypothetical protein